MLLRLEPNSQPTFSSSSGQRVASSLRLRSASRASDTLMVNFSMVMLICPPAKVDTVRVQLLLIVPGSRSTRKLIYLDGKRAIHRRESEKICQAPGLKCHRLGL